MSATISGEEWTATNVVFASAAYHRTFPDRIPLTETAQTLPDARGSGYLRDLREAMSLGTPEAEALVAAVREYAAATDRAGQMAVLDRLLDAWALTGGGSLTPEDGLRFDEASGEWRYLSSDDPMQPIISLVFENIARFPTVIGGYASSARSDGTEVAAAEENATTPDNPYAETLAYLRAVRDLRVVEIFMGDPLAPAPIGGTAENPWPNRPWFVAQVETLGVVSLDENGALAVTPGFFTQTVWEGHRVFLAQTYAAIKDNIHGELVLQTRLKPYLDALTAPGGSGAAVEAMLESLRATQPLDALADLAELSRYAGRDLVHAGWNPLPLLKEWADGMASNETAGALLREIGIVHVTEFAYQMWGTGAADVIILSHADVHSADGGPGNDLLLGSTNDESLFGGQDDDLLDGRGGDDYLIGGEGNDTYVFGPGYGMDRVVEFGGPLDRIILAALLTPADVRIGRIDNHLKIEIPASGDVLTVDSWFANAAYRVEEVRFADGTTVDWIQLLNAPFIGTSRPDSLIGTDGPDVFYSGAAEDDLIGGDGNDTYHYRIGDGDDRINDCDTTPGNLDRIVFGDGISPGDVIATREWNDLVLTVGSGGDKLTVNSWFAGTAYRVEEVRFADGTVWDAVTLAAVGVEESRERVIRDDLPGAASPMDCLVGVPDFALEGSAFFPG